MSIVFVLLSLFCHGIINGSQGCLDLFSNVRVSGQQRMLDINAAKLYLNIGRQADQYGDILAEAVDIVRH